MKFLKFAAYWLGWTIAPFILLAGLAYVVTDHKLASQIISDLIRAGIVLAAGFGLLLAAVTTWAVDQLKEQRPTR